jgi:bacillaene synthase trans-acting acyltransferase
MLHLNEIIYQNTGLSIIDEIYNGEKGNIDKFDQLIYTHPAIFMVEYSLARGLIESGVEPDYVLGASLGEFTAAAVAGVISLEAALEFLLKQAELVGNNCRAGSMIAIIHNPELYHQSPVIALHSELAAVNYHSHFVISGDSEKLLNIENYLKTNNILWQTLPVRYGFHSSNIDPIASEYRNFLQNFRYKKPDIPIISCLLSGRTTEISAAYFWKVVREPVRFQQTNIELEKDGCFDYIDVGPSGTMANFTKQNLSKDSRSRCYSIMTPFHQDLKNLTAIEKLFSR